MTTTAHYMRMVLTDLESVRESFGLPKLTLLFYPLLPSSFFFLPKFFFPKVIRLTLRLLLSDQAALLSLCTVKDSRDKKSDSRAQIFLLLPG